MNDKIRFIVLTTLMIAALPFTIILVFIGWLVGELTTVRSDYVKFYHNTWRKP